MKAVCDTIAVQMSAFLAVKNVAPQYSMPLVRTPERFGHEQFVFELKHDGFRALPSFAAITASLSRRSHVARFRSSPKSSPDRSGRGDPRWREVPASLASHRGVDAALLLPFRHSR